MSERRYQRYTVRAIDEFGRLYYNSHAFGSIEDLEIRGFPQELMRVLILPILKKMGEDASAEWVCIPETWKSIGDGWDYQLGAEIERLR